ncbi:hypothetical protein [Pontibacillus salipaludis]|uniref:hypothetical protein n=1 Tax=Pontibacillus salipaludis TaxID=1697394 RepID=UPI0031EC5B53
MTISNGLQTKIEELKAKQEENTSTQMELAQYNQQITQELQEAREELEAAVVKTAKSPKAANRTAEKEARKKVKELEEEAESNQVRMQRLFSTGSGELSALRKEVLKEAGSEFLQNYKTEKPKILSEIEQAKADYLKGIKKLHDLTMEETQEAYYDISRDISAADTLAREYEPGVSMHLPLLTYRANGENYVGITEEEVLKAFRSGKIEKGSVKGD